MRDAFFNKLYEFVKRDKNVVILTADHGAFGLKKIQQDYPDQYINVGIAEQALISIASGLAKCGKKVYVYAINNFVSLRVLEQINVDLCAMNLDVNIIAVGAGFTYSTDGPTHHGVQDLAAMCNLPLLQVYNVTDDLSTKKLVELSYKQPGPKYFRIEKGFLPRIYSNDDLIGLGYKEITKNNSDLGIISTGFMTHIVDKIVKQLNNEDRKVSHLDVVTINPLPEEKIVEFSKNKRVVIIEENLASGSLGEKICALLKRLNHRQEVLNISIKNSFYFDFGTREFLHQKAGLDQKTLITKIKNFYNPLLESHVGN